jgi:hypothetical protein
LGQVPEGSSSETESQEDDLTRALPDIERFGFQTVRIFVGGRYDYIHPKWAPERFADVEKPVTLAKILALPYYRRLLEHPQLTTIWLTAYPVVDYGQGSDEINLRRHVPEREWKQEYEQMGEMVEWLCQNLGHLDKVILISNHEGDEKLREVLDSTGRPDLAVANLERNLRTRFQAVSAARARFPSARLKVLFGVEISLWQLKLHRDSSGKYVKGKQGLNALEAILPQLSYDFVSFSSWEVLARQDVEAALGEALEDIGKRTRGGLTPAGAKAFGPRHVLLGEFGYARDWKLKGEIRDAGLATAVKLLREDRIPYAVYWQLYDNLEGDTKQFGLIDPEGRITCVGQFFLSELGRKLPSKEQIACPESEVPASAPTGSAVPVVLTIGGVMANVVTIAMQ